MNLENTEKLSVKERLMIFINAENLSQSKFEKMTNLSNGYVNNIRNSISDKIFDGRIHPVFPKLNKIWLLHGEGEMIVGNNDEQKNEDDNNASIIKNKPHDEQMEILLNKIENLEQKIEIYQERDALYLKSIIAFFEIDKVKPEIKEIDNKKSSTN
ncbi:hypothetical protein U9K52_10030 [Chryseobacterium sp. MHB01]|uniref:hypothetical protein n=1 Tax=Chryseobacterium sp. MHB01 TaxID=3109433 RepID=UPI002AFF6D37|nr:hypothetical protein [Chryseobacterium sp. MHB01]MEA1849251.1 hypothetical protein [Chryseobacterium sp. MHB01]